MTYTILFTDSKHRTAGIVVISYEEDDTSPAIIRHSHGKNQYEQGWLLAADDFEPKPFYLRQAGEEGQEVHFALAVLQERLNGTPAKGGLAFGRKQ